MPRCSSDSSSSFFSSSPSFPLPFFPPLPTAAAAFSSLGLAPSSSSASSPAPSSWLGSYVDDVSAPDAPEAAVPDDDTVVGRFCSRSADCGGGILTSVDDEAVGVTVSQPAASAISW